MPTSSAIISRIPAKGNIERIRVIPAAILNPLLIKLRRACHLGSGRRPNSRLNNIAPSFRQLEGQLHSLRGMARLLYRLFYTQHHRSIIDYNLVRIKCSGIFNYFLFPTWLTLDGFTIWVN